MNKKVRKACSEICRKTCPACPAREPRRRVFVAMSGGVDSSVAAALLKDQGYDVVGIHMKCWSQKSSDELGIEIPCTATQDAEDARRAAQTLGIPFYVVNFEKEYRENVINYMIGGYKKGITPNPDVMCNKQIKFGLLLNKALKMGADYIATGHYVRLVKCKMRHGNKKDKSCHLSLFAARDNNKDQSYFLWTLTPEQLKYCLFPIGDITKPEVRKLAKKYHLPNADKKDSQGLCFVGKVNVKKFLEKYLPFKKGIVVNTKGEIVGEHEGAQFYTIGQRHIGVGKHQKGESEARPYYVAEKDIKSNAILVAEENNPVLYKKEIKIINANWINGKPKNNQMVLMRVRYRQPLFNAIIKGNKIIFEKAQKFVAPGQSAVFYLPVHSRQQAAKGGAKNGEMLGGGIIR